MNELFESFADTIIRENKAAKFIDTLLEKGVEPDLIAHRIKLYKDGYRQSNRTYHEPAWGPSWEPLPNNW